MSNVEKTLSIIKPDAVERNLVEEIKNIFLKNKLNILDSKKIALVINTGGGNTEHRLNDAIALRRGTLKNKVPYCTNMSTAQACLEAIKSLKTKKLEVTSLQDIKNA